MNRIAKWSVVALVMLLLAGGIAYIWQRIQAFRDSANRSVCGGHVKYHASSLELYQKSNNGKFPPAFVLGPDGMKWHSWRVLLLEYMSEWEPLYKEYRFDEPWNGPNNSKLATRMPKLYGCPGDPESAAKGFTNYFAVVGPGTMFPHESKLFEFFLNREGRVLPATKDGKPFFQVRGWSQFTNIPRPSETILLVESAGRGINWMEPRDLTLDDMSFILNDPNAPSISSRHRGPNVAFADGSERMLYGLDPETLRRMCLVDPDKKPEKKEAN